MENKKKRVLVWRSLTRHPHVLEAKMSFHILYFFKWKTWFLDCANPADRCSRIKRQIRFSLGQGTYTTDKRKYKIGLKNSWLKNSNFIITSPKNDNESETWVLVLLMHYHFLNTLFSLVKVQGTREVTRLDITMQPLIQDIFSQIIDSSHYFPERFCDFSCMRFPFKTKSVISCK